MKIGNRFYALIQHEDRDDEIDIFHTTNDQPDGPRLAGMIIPIPDLMKALVGLSRDHGTKMMFAASSADVIEVDAPAPAPVSTPAAGGRRGKAPR